MYGYDTEGMDDSLESWIRRHPDYDPSKDTELQGIDYFIVVSAKSRIGCWDGSGADCAAILGLAIMDSYIQFRVSLLLNQLQNRPKAMRV
jgi:hypothetical protein